MTTQENNIEELQEQTMDSGESDQSTWLSDTGKQIGKKVISKTSTSTITSVMSSLANFLSTLIIALGSVLLAIILLIIVLYIAYIGILKAWCNRRICTECEKYLHAELDAFIQSNSFVQKLDEAIKISVSDYEEEYLVILNQIFSGSSLDAQNEEQNCINRFYELRESWNRIKYE